MTRTLRALFVLTLIAFAGCADRNTATESNVAPSFSRNGRSATLLEGQLPYAPPVEKVIGAGGGILVLRGPDRGGAPTYHALYVTPGAVKENTLFTMELGDARYAGVELRAYRISDSHGRGEEVGHLGFQRPLYLTLSYAWAEQPVNPNRLTVVHVIGGQIQPERIRTMPWRANKTVVGEIRHFSRYNIAVQ